MRRWGGTKIFGPVSFKLLSKLLALFAVSFAAPILLVYFIGPTKTEKKKSLEELFEHVYTVKRNDAHLRVANDPTINPNPSEDFLAFCWVKFSYAPKERGRVTLFSKIEEGTSSKGFAFGISRDERSFRPVALWTDGMHSKKWMYFSEFPLIPHQWVLIALSVQEGQLVGFYSGTYSDGKASASLLGGYDLETQIDASSNSPLKVGYSKSVPFRGQLGPFGILRGKGIAPMAKEIVKSIALNPNRIPRSIEPTWLSLWTIDLSTSFGSKGLPIIAIEK